MLDDKDEFEKSVGAELTALEVRGVIALSKRIDRSSLIHDRCRSRLMKVLLKRGAIRRGNVIVT